MLIGGVVEGMTWLGTFHSIGVKILRRHAELVGLKPAFTILDTDDQIRLLKQILSKRTTSTRSAGRRGSSPPDRRLEEPRPVAGQGAGRRSAWLCQWQGRRALSPNIRSG